MLAPSSWLREFAPGYRDLSRGERRAISDFVLLWSVFEDQVLGRNATADGMLAKVDRWIAADRLDPARCAASWTHFAERLTEGTGLSHRFDGLRIGRPAHAAIVREALLDPSAGSDPRACNRALAIIVYRIRNNLLHGEKWSYGLAAQEDNFRHCSHKLMTWTDADRGRYRSGVSGRDGDRVRPAPIDAADGSIGDAAVARARASPRFRPATAPVAVQSVLELEPANRGLRGRGGRGAGAVEEGSGSPGRVLGSEGRA